MKYTPGDCLSFKTGEQTFLAGFVSAISDAGYNIALTNYNSENSPPADHFTYCPLFAVSYEMGETSFSALDICTISSEYADHSDEITLVYHHEIPGRLSSAGFHSVMNMAELAGFYETGVKIRNGETENIEIPSFETKCLIDIREVFKNAPPPNEFSTVKLYKNINGMTHYWQVYGNSIDSIGLVVNWGKLGEVGEWIEIKDLSLEDLREIYTAKIGEKKEEGYEEPENLQPMILQFETSDAWGATDDLDFRNEIWEYLDRILYWTGNGQITGGDIGSGTVNLFLVAIIPEIARNTIIQALSDKKIDRQFLIAIESPAEISVIYPENYQLPFHY